ncbi:MAG: class I SAM-dependent methyltransferase [Brevibacterium sp.]|uniref:O-methyltransferase n=1 Tax=Brevibacterium sp. TaxID=1701 RepID=UPI002649A4D4|nr:class I SAM-dependent methyltransferase [Brevibacterium sp.]MDN6134415.1 class I SAM-dependent methyltransferase [Brevibacterium sp.]MDN6175814.1 class I SAM-dependent methyltransferase [Brevibacterium sp.]MDN6189302.1 class I SAM-dependent methyltransferase [Brevibacterium sp.]MDN6604401.1 class I SAM-dependent methyltransferase [Brevibacterium sp.]MDN6667068.1 class I SAM-dependent methyltransferase [Brevibacterium sp.]
MSAESEGRLSRENAVDLTFSEQYNGPDPLLDAARALSHENGLAPVSQTTAATLTLLARLLSPVAAVEVGTGAGTSTLALLRGMPNAGILTSIDTNSTAQSAARDLTDMAGIRRSRLRLMSGRAEDVLQRLAPGAYDMVFVDSEPTNLERMVEPALRLLDTHGLLVIHQTLLKGGVADPVDRSPRTQAARGLLNRLAGQERLERVLLPVGQGLLMLQKSLR